MKQTTRILVATAALLAGCAGSRKATWADVQQPVVYVETLPPGAMVRVNGAEVGQGPLTIPVPDESRSYALRVTSPGFEALETTVSGAKLAGARLELLLRPEGFGTQRELQAGEPVGLYQAAVALLRADRARDALAYAKASLAAGESAQAHRVCGLAYQRLGNRDLAIKELSLYLSQAPDGPDRRAVEAAISAAARDIDMAPARPPTQ